MDTYVKLQMPVISDPNPISWTVATSGKTIIALAQNDSITPTFYKSTDQGITWTPLSNNLPYSSGSIYQFAVSGNIIVAISNNTDTYISTDLGETAFVVITFTDIPDFNWKSISISGNTIISHGVDSTTNYMYKYVYTGGMTDTWQQIQIPSSILNPDPGNPPSYAIRASVSGNIIALAYTSDYTDFGVYISTSLDPQTDADWTFVTVPVLTTALKALVSIYIEGDTIVICYLGASQASQELQFINPPIYISKNIGKTWSALSPLPTLSGDSSKLASWDSLFVSGNTIGASYRIETLSEPNILILSGVYLFTLQEPPISNICFFAGTHISLDQGEVPIEKINPSKHTLTGQPIRTVTKTITNDNYVVCFEKGALGLHIPNRKTTMSADHLIQYQGRMVPAKTMVPQFAQKVPYNDEIMYNVLLDDYGTMMANGMRAETLHPENPMAQAFLKKSKFIRPSSQSQSRRHV